MLSSADMERVLENLDRRLSVVEQTLPTLATKTDLERFATRADLERLATKQELAVAIGDLKRHTDMRFEDLRDDISKVAEGVASMASAIQTNQATLEQVVIRLDKHEDVLNALVRKHGV